jgi:single-strand DNA-binding protein
MNELKNSVRLIGRVGNEPQVKKLGNGRTVVNFSVATTETYTDHEGNKKSETTWHRLVAWGQPAAVAEKYLKKGSEVAVEGKLTNRSWDGKDGEKHYITEVNINSLLLLDKNGNHQDVAEKREDLPF